MNTEALTRIRPSEPAARHRRLLWIMLPLSLAIAGCGVPGPDGPADSYGLDFTLPADASTSGAIVFCVDGMNAEIFSQMLSAGELPAIKKYFVDRGLYAPRAVANIPSVTLANLTSLTTGLFPGHHGITGVNWFDRNRLIWRNYDTIAQKNMLDRDYRAASIYELLGERTTFSVFFQPHRGATKFVENWTSAGPPFFFGWYEFVDRLTLWRLNIVADVARRRRSWPAVTIVYLLAPDFRAYRHGVRSQQYRLAMRHTDRQIGRICGDLQAAGLLDKLHLALVSDHGLGEVTRHFPMDDFLRDEVGLRLASKRLWEETPFEERLEYYRQYPVVTYGSGDRYWAICLRKQIRGDTSGAVAYEPWPRRPTAEDLTAYPLEARGKSRSESGPPTCDLLAALVEQEAVDAVAYSVGANRVRVRRKAGEVEFRQPAGPGGPISYHLIDGQDPFGWRGVVPEEMLGGDPADSRAWLKATCRSEYPDLPPQIIAYFRAHRAGDIAVFAAEGWDFRSQNRAGHGGLGPQEMHVPMLLAGPGIEPRQVQAARTVDLVPTLLDLLGQEPPSSLDGISLLAETTD